MTRHLLIIAAALAVAVCLAPTPTQAGSHGSSNAHRYQGGPKTETPHTNKQSKRKADQPEADDEDGGGHHYSGGPKSEQHHMGKKR